MSSVLPETVTECGGCDEELNLLSPHLSVQIKAERNVLVADAGSPFDATQDTPAVSLGTQSGRGRLVNFHNFDCVRAYGEARKDKAVSLEPHVEDEVYVPADNREPEELVKDGEMQAEMLAVFAAREEESA